MGTVLEMMHHLKKLVALVVLCGISACGTLREEGPGEQVVALATGLVTGQADSTARATLAVTEEEIFANPGQYMRVNIRNLDRWDTMVASAQNGNRTTWVDSENNTVTLDNGVVVATRGLPRDLMGADVSQVWAAIRAGGGNAQRTLEILTDRDQNSQQLLQSRIDAQGSDTVRRLRQELDSQRFEEICDGDGLQFTNIYWLNRNGVLLRSLQAISPDAGYLQIDVF